MDIAVIGLLAATGAAADLREQLRAAAEATSGRFETRVASKLDRDPLAAMAGARRIEPLGALVEIRGPEGTPVAELSGPLGAIVERAPLVDRDRSAVAAGARHVVLGGVHALVVALSAVRRPETSPSEFRSYWLERHARFALSLLDDAARGRFGYAQVHVDAAASAEAARSTGLAASSADGVLLVSVNDVADLPHASVPGFARAIEADERNFVDGAATMTGALLRVV